MFGTGAAPSSNKLAGVDVLRALAALIILVVHVVGMSNGQASEPLVGIGRTGRRLFLVLSGFLLFLPYARAAYGQGPGVNAAMYALRRVLRLLPLYVTAVFALALPGFLHSWPATGKDLLYHLLFIHVYDASTFYGLAAPLWFIAVIAHWYVLLPVVGWLWLKLKHRLAVWTAATLVLTAAHAFAWASPPMSQDTFRVVVDKGFLGALPFFFAAMTAAAYFVRARSVRARSVRARQDEGPSARLLPIAWLSASALLAAVLVLFRWQGGHYLSPLVLSAVAFGFAFAPAGGSLLAPVRSFGRISYSVFVWHAPIIMAVSQLGIFQRIEHGALRTALMLAAVLPPVLLVSCVSYRLLEKPFLKPKIASPRRLLVRLAAAYACIVLASAVLFAAEQARSRGNAGPADARAQVQPDRVHSAVSP